jgi:cell division septal protein FtsQ
LFYSALFKVTKVEFLGLDSQEFPVFVDKSKLQDIEKRFQQKDAPTLILCNLNKIEEEVKAIPGVKTATSAKVWPHKLVIIIEPREPIGKVGNKLVDVEGVELGNAIPDKFFPEVVASDVAKHDVGLLLDAIRGEGLDIASISATTRDDITIKQKSGFTIVFGNINQLTLKLADIKRILGSEITAGKSTLDVSSPKSPIVR